MMPRRLFLSAVLALVLALPAAAQQATDPANFIATLSDKAIQVLSNKALTQADREQQFRTFMQSYFDIAGITQSVLGRYNRTASDQEKQDFTKLFQEYVLRTYTARFSQYSGQSLKVTGSRAESDASTLVFSNIVLPNGAPPAKVDWRVEKKGADLRITDVNVEGASMVRTQREEFASVIQRNGGNVASLNQFLREKNGG